MQVVIKIDEARFKDIQRIAEVQLNRRTDTVEQLIANGTPLLQEPKMGHCKDCKYFEYDKWLYINEMPVIVAHEICNKWGAGGWKTKEDGFCFMFEKKEEKENG